MDEKQKIAQVYITILEQQKQLFRDIYCNNETLQEIIKIFDDQIEMLNEKLK